MKTIITTAVILLSIQSFSQNSFLKRKYTKGNFIERVSHLHHEKKTIGVNKTEVVTPPSLVMNDVEINGLMYVEYVDSTKALVPNKRIPTEIKHEGKRIQDTKDLYSNIEKRNTVTNNCSPVYASTKNDFTFLNATSCQNNSYSLKTTAADPLGFDEFFGFFKGIGDTLILILISAIVLILFFGIIEFGLIFILYFLGSLFLIFLCACFPILEILLEILTVLS